MKSNDNVKDNKDTVVKKDDIINALKKCYDPEIPVNIVDLGLIYDLNISNDGVVEIKMTLTAIGCPLADMLSEEVKNELMQIKGVKEVLVELVWDPPWTPDKMSDEARRMLGI
ncbi:MAG: metal-sulfur cluster assembly factor [Thermoplasmata archaeon]